MKKILFFKSLLITALLGAGANGAWADPVYFGSSGKDLGPWAEGVLVSPDYTVMKGSTVTVNYLNETNTLEATWQGYWNGMFEFSGTDFWITTRADRVTGETWAKEGFLWTTTYSDNFEAQFTRDNMDGASVVLTVTRGNDNKVEVLSTNTKGSNTWWKKVEFTVPNDDNMVFRLRAEKCYGTINSVICDKFVGPASNSTTWWNNFSEYYTIEANKTLTLNFKNYSSKTKNWNNFVTVITNDKDRGADGYSEQVVIRTDNYGWGTYYNNSNFSNNYNWATYMNDLDGADVELKIRRSGEKVAVKATYTTTGGNKYYQQYVYTGPSASETFRAFLTVDQSHIEGLTSSVADTPASPAEYIYTIKAVDGSDNDLQTFATGAYWTGEDAINIGYNKFILSGTTLHSIAANGSTPYYRKSFTPNANNYVGKVEYSESIPNVVYYSEAEDISGFSASTDGNTYNCASGSKAARSAGNYNTLTTLTPGKYKVYLGGLGDSNSRTVSVKAGNSEVLSWTIPNSNAATTNSEDFIIAANTTMTAACSGTTATGLDWVYIQQTAVSKSITSAGWATYCSPYALDLENATKLTDAYIVTGGDGSALAKTSVKGGTVPANTGLLLKGTEGTEGTVTIPVVASSSTDVSGNKLTGVLTDTEIAANVGYVLMASPSLGFYKNENAFTVGANTAYLPANFDGSGARFFFLLDDDVTAINSAKRQELTANGQYFDLQGRKVANPTKGLYIVNGRKVIVK